MWCRGIRGTTTVADNTKEAIIAASKELLQKMIEVNDMEIKDVAGVLFTTTPDINAEFPAAAARELDWTQTALLCGHEIDVPGSLPRCLRALMLFNAEKSNEGIAHAYLKDAQRLKEDKA